MVRPLLFAALMAVASVLARDIPQNVRTLYNSIRAQDHCSNTLATGFWSSDRGSNSPSPFLESGTVIDT